MNKTERLEQLPRGGEIVVISPRVEQPSYDH